MGESIRSHFRRISNKVWTALGLLVLWAAQEVFTRLGKHYVPEGQETGFLARVAQWMRGILAIIPADFVLGAAVAAFALYLWDERKRMIAAGAGAARRFLAPWRQRPATGKLFSGPSSHKTGVAQTSSERVAFQPPARSLTGYEVEQKLRVIDEAIAILRDDMEATVADGPRFHTNAWNAFKHPELYPTYGRDFAAFRDRYRANLEKLDKLRERIPEYQDIVGATQQTYWETCHRAFDDFLVRVQSLSSYLKPDTPHDVFEASMSHEREAFGEALQEFVAWRNSARGRLTGIRSAISP